MTYRGVEGWPTRANFLEAGIEPSVGSVGDSYDNALAETINGLYKAEVIRRPWPVAQWASRRMGELVQPPTLA